MELEQTLESRGKTHGDYRKVAYLSQRLKATIEEVTTRDKAKLNAPHLESLDMICSKIARICCGNPNEPDHWHDIAGYATLVEKELRGKKE